MKKIYLIFLITFSFGYTFAQSENCSGATLLTNGACVLGTSGTSQNIVGCVGNADDDVWYKFVATNTSHSITVTGSSNFDAVLQVFSGTCSALISNGCVDNTLSGQIESTVESGLTIGSTYYVRVYHYGIGSGSGSFNICLNNAPTPPANDNCNTAINLAVNSGCSNTNGTTFGATQSISGCAGTANDDVWYSFTATNYTQTIQVAGSANFDAVIEFFDGFCGTLVSKNCMDNTFLGGTETLIVSGLTPSATYYFRVYDYFSGSGNTFSICVSGTSIIAGSQPNDEPCTAIQLPLVTADCNNLVYSNVGATPSSIPGSPGAVCENYNNSTNSYGSLSAGGFNAATTRDVWFAITVPASGNIYITPQPNMGNTWIQDGVMALYRGTCNSLTTYTCSDDFNYIAGYNDLQPFIRAVGLTPNETVYLRYYGYGNAQGNFGFCVQSPTNGECATALYICDINGYSATTSPAYNTNSLDHPCNMRGNGEGPGPAYGYTVGINPAGPFGAGGSWGTGSPAQDVTIDNPSWVRFTAASPTVTLKVTVSNCWGTGINSNTTTVGTPRGIQMQIFSTSSACCGFVPVSDFKENLSTSFIGGVSTFTVNANSLVTGSDYYVMIDGWGNDICNYNIQALAGVALPAITAVPGTICPGQSSILTAPTGATGYTWQPGGQTTQTISVAPGTQMTYTCYAGGVCGYKQTLTKTVFLYATPNVSATITNSVFCNGGSTAITGTGANTYTWTSGLINGVAISPTTTTSYSVTGTSVNGCTNTAIATVTVNPLPTVSYITTSSVICKGNSTTLSGSGTATTYTWSGGINNGVAFSPTSTNTYTVTGIDANGCVNKAVTTVTVNPIPTTTVSTLGTITCATNTVNLNSTSVAGASYTWTAPSGNSILTGTNSQNAIGQGLGTYTLQVLSSAGCTYSATIATNNNTTTPTASATNGTLTCAQTSTILVGSPASGVTYNWSGPGIVGSNVVASITASVVGNYSLVTTNISNGCSSTVTAIGTLTNNLTTPTVSAGSNQIITCAAPTVTLTGNATTNSNLSWSNGATTKTTTVGGSGTYTLTATNPITGCSSKSTVQVMPSAGTPTGNINPPSNIINCSLNSSTISIVSSLSPLTYAWTGPGIIASPSSSSTAVSQGGTYTVTITNTASCSQSYPVVVTTNTTPVTASAIIAASASITCITTSLTLSSTPTGANYTYSWSGPNIISGATTANPIVGSAGNYSVTITNTINGCSGTNGTTYVSVPSNTNVPSLNLSANSATTTCSNTSTIITATSNSNPNTTYTWIAPSTGTISDPSISNPSLGGYGVFTVSATNSITGCVSLTKTVSVIADSNTPTFTLSSNTATINCINPAPSVTVVTNQTSLSYSWSPTPNSGASSVSPTFTAIGNYTLTITNAVNGCTTSAILSVGINTIAPTLSVTTTNSVISCSNNSTTLSATSSVTDIPIWTLPSGTSASNPVIAISPGTYTATVTDANNGCSTTKQIIITSNIVLPDINAAATATMPCGSGTVTLIGATVITNSVSYSWVGPNSGSIISGSNTANPTVTTTGTYTLTLTNINSGCTATTVVNVYQNNVTADFTYNPQTGEAPLTVDFTNQSTGATSYNWNFGNGSTSTNTNPSTIYNNNGTFTIVLIATSANCSDTTSKTIIIEDGFIIEIPNVFTPNGDGANDVFHIKIKGVKSAEGFIYNRWGQLLYSWNALNTSWDGKASNGENCPDGNYFYIIKVIDNKDKMIDETGHVLIIR